MCAYIYIRFLEPLYYNIYIYIYIYIEEKIITVVSIKEKNIFAANVDHNHTDTNHDYCKKIHMLIINHFY